jgi:methyl-galactoside transport system substrate-binding protein
MLLSSCSKRNERTGLFVYNETDPFMQVFAGQIMAEADGKFPIQLYYAKNSQAIQNEQIEAELENNPSLLMINPVDRLGSYSIIRTMKEKNIPVIFFNREPLAEDLGLWDKVYYVGAKAAQSGQLQARLVMELFGSNSNNLNELDKNNDGKIQLIILKGEQGHQDAETRTSEVLKSFQENNFAIDLLAIEVANWNFNEAAVKTQKLLQKFQHEVELFISNNDDMALGAIQTMREAGFLSDTNNDGHVNKYDHLWIPVVGIDGLEEAQEAIASGFLYGTVKNDSKKMTEVMIELSLILLGKKDFSSLSVPLVEDKYLWIDYSPYIFEEKR